MSAETCLRPIQEGDPTVSMSVAWRDQVPADHVLEFNYQAYQRSAEIVAGRPVDLADVEISITYDPKCEGSQCGQRLAVGASLESPTETQGTFLHETKHLIDYMDDRFENGALIARTHRAANAATERIPTAQAVALGHTAIFAAPLLA